MDKLNQTLINIFSITLRFMIGANNAFESLEAIREQLAKFDEASRP
jgi:hypothetical protein